MGPFNSLGPHKSLPCALSNCKWNTPQWLLLDVLPTLVGESLEAKPTTKQNNKNKTLLWKYKWTFLVWLLKLKVGHYSCLLLFFTTPMHPHLLQQPTSCSALHVGYAGRSPFNTWPHLQHLTAHSALCLHLLCPDPWLVTFCFHLFPFHQSRLIPHNT